MIPLGIKAFVDFAFKMIFGSPENSIALIGLLNAILELERPITEVTILNPFNRKEFETDKFIVLDIKARDSAGRLFNIEMGTARLSPPDPAGLRSPLGVLGFRDASPRTHRRRFLRAEREGGFGCCQTQGCTAR